MRRLILGLVVVSSLAVGRNARDVDSLFIAANQYMNREKYEDAVRLYEKILSQGYEHPDLYYNLGNGYYRLGFLGQAVWAYEKGLRFRPRDPDLRFNLDLVNAHIRDRIEIPETFFLLELYRALKSQFTLSDLLLVGSGLLLLASFLFAVNRISGNRFNRMSKFIGVIFVLAILVHGVALDKYWELSDKREGVVVEREVEAFSAPFERRDAVLFKVHEGIKVEITQRRPDWIEIVLLDGKKGWVRANSVREL